MQMINQLLDRKGRDVVFVGPDDSVLDAIRVMAEKGIGAVLVMQEGRLEGIFSERDYARKVIIRGRSSESTRVAEIMSTGVVTTTGSESVVQCMNTMTERKIRHLPVMEGEQVVGVISIGDLVNAIISDQQKEIEHLENYISGY